MAQERTKKSATRKVEKVEVSETPAPARTEEEKQTTEAKLKAADEVLDEIEKILEEEVEKSGSAQAFVENFLQRGGQ